jgi:hypothetical protein
MRAVLKAQINKTDRNDARDIAQMMRVGLYRPVHVKTLRSQKLRVLRKKKTELCRRGSAFGRRQGFRHKLDPRSQSGKSSRYRDKSGRRQADTRRQDRDAIRGRRGIVCPVMVRVHNPYRESFPIENRC